MKKTLALTIMVLLLVSAVAGIEFVRNACANPGLVPEEPPYGFTINSDGTYIGENIRRDGNTYTLTGDINCTLVVERDGIVLDGAGYTVQGNGTSSGVWFQDKSNITIKNLNIRNFRIGINLSPNYSSAKNNENCTISANNITNNTYGISMATSYECYVAGNCIANNTNGVFLHGSNNVFRSNKLEKNQYAIFDEGYGDNDLDTSNTIDNKPIYYWVNQHDRTVPSDAGFVILKNCSAIKVENLNLQGNENGLLLCYTNDSTISGNLISNNLNGITLRYSFNNIISDNRVTNNKNSGIETYEAHNNRILRNIIRANGYGATCKYSKNNVFSNNQIVANTNTGIDAESDCTITDNFISENLAHGIYLSNISGALIAGNNVTLNKGWGIVFDYGPNGTIKGNYIAKNEEGIVFSNAVGNIIMSNTVIQNNGWGIHLAGSHRDNLIYHNNFIDNNNKGTQAFVKDVWFYPDLYKRHMKNDTIELPRQVPGAANAWDDGIEGNYWSDYTSRYPDAQVENSTVGNTPYFINDNNKDNHPLLAPHEISTFELPSPSAVPSPSIQPPQESNSTPTPTIETEPALFPIALVITSAVSVAAIVVGLLLYFVKRKGEIKQ